MPCCDRHSLSSSGLAALGEAYLTSGQTSEGLDILENLLKSDQEVLKAADLLAPIYHERGQYEQEARVLRIWLKADPQNLQASEKLGLLLAADGTPEALALLNSAAAGSGQARARLADLISALEIPEGDAAYRLTNCGQALANLNEWPLAEQAFGLAVVEDKTYGEAWAWLGLARQHDKTPGAQQALETAVNLNPQSASIHAMFGAFYQQGGNPGEALKQFKTATQLEPGNPAWWAALAGAATQTDLTVALNANIQAVNLAPQEPSYWYNLAAFCVERNAYIQDYGLNAALRAYALQPNNVLYMDMLGRTQLALGMNDPAEVMLKKALDAAGSPSQSGMIHFHLGLLYLQSGRNDLAKFEFEQTLALDPAGTYGSQAKKLLERYFP